MTREQKTMVPTNTRDMNMYLLPLLSWGESEWDNTIAVMTQICPQEFSDKLRSLTSRYLSQNKHHGRARWLLNDNAETVRFLTLCVSENVWKDFSVKLVKSIRTVDNFVNSIKIAKLTIFTTRLLDPLWFRGISRPHWCLVSYQSDLVKRYVSEAKAQCGPETVWIHTDWFFNIISSLFRTYFLHWPGFTHASILMIL